MQRTPHANLILPKSYTKGKKERIIDTLEENFITIDNHLSTIQSLPIDVVGAEDGMILTYDASTGKFIPKLKPTQVGFLQSTILNINPSYQDVTLSDSGVTAYGGIESKLSKYVASNTTPYFTITKSSAYSSSYEPWNAFAGPSGNEWRTVGIANEWTKIDFLNPYSIRRLIVKPYQTNNSPSNILLESSNDDTNWVTQYSSSGLAQWSTRFVANTTDSTPYRYWRFTFNGIGTGASGTYFLFDELGLSLT